MKNGPAGEGVHADAPLVSSYDALGDGQPQTGAGDFLVTKGSKMRSRISSGMPGPLSEMVTSTWGRSGRCGKGNAHRQGSARRAHGFNRVTDQVGKHLLERAWITQHKGVFSSH